MPTPKLSDEQVAECRDVFEKTGNGVSLGFEALQSAVRTLGLKTLTPEEVQCMLEEHGTENEDGSDYQLDLPAFLKAMTEVLASPAAPQ